MSSFVAELQESVGSSFANPEPASGTANEQTSGPDPGDESPEPNEGAGEAEPETATDPELDQEVLKALADEEGLDLNDPAQRGIAERIARRDLKRQQVSSPSDDDAEQEFTPFEKQVFGEEPEESATETQPRNENGQFARTTTEANGNGLLIKGQPWKSVEDAHFAELEELGAISEKIASGKQPGPSDLSRLAEIKRDQFRVGLIQEFPVLQQAIVGITNHLIQQALGGLTPALQPIIEQHSASRALQSAVADLSATKEFKDARTLLRQEEGTVRVKDPVTGQSHEFPNTPLNRILKANPDLLQIDIRHSNPDVARRLTATAIMKAAMRIQGKQRTSTDTAKQLVAAGQKIEARKATDKPRQQLNAGPGATTKGGSAPQSFVDELKEHQPTTFSDLFRGK